jgi:hypothetical protein
LSFTTANFCSEPPACQTAAFCSVCGSCLGYAPGPAATAAILDTLWTVINRLDIPKLAQPPAEIFGELKAVFCPFHWTRLWFDVTQNATRSQAGFSVEPADSWPVTRRGRIWHPSPQAIPLAAPKVARRVALRVAFQTARQVAPLVALRIALWIGERTDEQPRAPRTQRAHRQGTDGSGRAAG